MLSSVLNSKKAIEVNIAIIRTFTLIRKMLLAQDEVSHEINEIKRAITIQDNNIQLIFEYFRQLEEARQQESEQREMRRIGYKRQDEQ